MSLIKRWLDAPVPAELFHYTSLEGLLGIVGRKELWASKAIFTNDAREFKLALELRQKLLQGVSDDTREDLLDSLERIAQINVFIASFSSHSDLLSQWRGYCPPGAGYSLGFDSRLLSLLGSYPSFSFYLGRFIYEPLLQRQIIAEVIEAEVARRIGGLARTERHVVDEMDFETALCFVAPLLKDASFKEEAEWRLITRPMSTMDPRFAFRPARSHLIPFYRISLLQGDSADFALLRRLVIGPTPHPALAEDAVGSFLGSQGLGSSCVVEHSVIPYRSW